MSVAPDSTSNSITATQTDINGIPLAAIERIEILPSSAGGIYGGGAVGGVINIVRRRDYNGMQVDLTYEGAFRGGGEAYRASVTGGASFADGRTRISFTASQSSARPLLAGDNDLALRGRELLVASNPNGTTAGTIAGYTPNIRSQTGATLVLDPQYGGTSLGSNHTYVPVGYRGVTVDGTAGLVANAGRYNIDLPNDLRGRLGTLRNNPRIRALNLNLRQEIAGWLEGYADFTFNENLGRARSLGLGGGVGTVTLAADAPNNPFQQAITVQYPLIGLERDSLSRSRSEALTIGLIGRIGSSWSASLEYGWNRSSNRITRTDNPVNQAGLAALQSGSLDVVRDLNAVDLGLAPFQIPGPDVVQPYKSTLQLASARLTGTLFNLPGGPLALTALAERRFERAPDTLILSTSVGPTFPLTLNSALYPGRHQNVTSGYLELRAPLLSNSDIPLLHAVELQGSVRYDRYDTDIPVPPNYSLTAPPAVISRSKSRQDSLDYTVALRWLPVRDVTFRASYSTGFLAPNLGQLIASLVQTFTAPIALDPLRNNQPLGAAGSYTLTLGGNPNLEPEDSRSLSFGLILTPRFIRGLRFSADYTRISKTNEIGRLSTASILANEAALPGRVVRAPLTAADQAAGFTAGRVTALDMSLVNVARTRVAAWDFQLDYDIGLAELGALHLNASATHQTAFRRRVTPITTSFDAVGFSDGPLKWRLSGGVEWVRGPLRIAWYAQYYGPYLITYADPSAASTSAARILDQGSSRIRSQIYHDLDIRYTLEPWAGRWLSGTTISAGIANIFDSSPPILATSAIAGGYSPYGDPRLRRFTLSVSRQF